MSTADFRSFADSGAISFVFHIARPSSLMHRWFSAIFTIRSWNGKLGRLRSEDKSKINGIERNDRNKRLNPINTYRMLLIYFDGTSLSTYAHSIHMRHANHPDHLARNEALKCKHFTRPAYNHQSPRALSRIHPSTKRPRRPLPDCTYGRSRPSSRRPTDKYTC